MKALFTITILMSLGAVTWIAAEVPEGDVWYNATGKVVKVTPVQRGKERFVPAWEKRDAVRTASREAGWDRWGNRGTIERTRSTYYGYGWNGYSGYRNYGGYYGYSGYSGHHSYHGHHFGGHSSFRFHGAYRKNGWSLRVKF